jgi:hypothetical protein
MATDTTWSRCSACKKEIGFQTIYWVCSVSTCTRKRTGMVFCSVGCWEMHLPMMRHREAYAVEERSPSRAEWLRREEEERAAIAAGGRADDDDDDDDEAPRPVRTVSDVPSRPSAPPGPTVQRRTIGAPEARPAVAASASTPAIGGGSSGGPALAQASTDDVLVVVSKLKKYIKDRSGMNTSDNSIEVLSDHLRAICDEAIRIAARDGRRTVMDRDFRPITRR